MILNSALQLFLQGGFLMFPLFFIVMVVLGIVVRTLWHLFVRKTQNAAVIQNCLDGLLFWGGFAVIIGVLGSAVGYHKAMTALAARGLAHPRALWIGTAEGMITTITGLLVLAAAGACWYGLRWWYLRDRYGSL